MLKQGAGKDEIILARQEILDRLDDEAVVDTFTSSRASEHVRMGFPSAPGKKSLLGN